jgi:hypothetical protein
MSLDETTVLLVKVELTAVGFHRGLLALGGAGAS